MPGASLIAPGFAPDWTVCDVAVHIINEQRRTLPRSAAPPPDRGTAEPLHRVSVAEKGSLPETTPDADLAAAWKHVGILLVAGHRYR